MLAARSWTRFGAVLGCAGNAAIIGLVLWLNGSQFTALEKDGLVRCWLLGGAVGGAFGGYRLVDRKK